jgi:HEAT repeat protein
VRRQAILTLVAIANEKTPLLLTEHFYKESLANRLVILDGLQKIATEQQAPFLIGLLEDENDLIKLKAAKTLALNTDGGLTLLEEKSRQTPEPYREIFLHIKSEYAL